MGNKITIYDIKDLKIGCTVHHTEDFVYDETVLLRLQDGIYVCHFVEDMFRFDDSYIEDLKKVRFLCYCENDDHVFIDEFGDTYKIEYYYGDYSNLKENF